MGKPTVSSESVAQDQLRSYFERWQRLEEEKRAISDDLKELFAEAKGFGFNTKVMRKLFRDETGDYSERMEFEAIYELYATALGTPVATHARPARPISTPPASQETTAADPAEGVIASSADTQSQIGIGYASTQGADSDRDASLTGVEGDEDRHINSLADSPTAEKGDKPESDILGKVAGQLEPGIEPVGGEVAQPPADPIHEPGKGALGESPSMASEPATGEGTGPQPSSVVPGRQPGCLNPDTCAGTWRKRCASCERAFMAVAAGGQAIVHQGAVS